MLRVLKLNPDAILPVRAHIDDAGYDLFSTSDILLKKGECVIVPTGIAISMPEGVYGRIAPRSSLGAKNVIVNAGVVDRGYTGELKVILSSISADYTVKKGDKIAQLILERHETFPVQEVQQLGPTPRGASGFGSTGA